MSDAERKNTPDKGGRNCKEWELRNEEWIISLSVDGRHPGLFLAEKLIPFRYFRKIFHSNVRVFENTVNFHEFAYGIRRVYSKSIYFNILCSQKPLDVLLIYSVAKV